MRRMHMMSLVLAASLALLSGQHALAKDGYTAPAPKPKDPPPVATTPAPVNQTVAVEQVVGVEQRTNVVVGVETPVNLDLAVPVEIDIDLVGPPAPAPSGPVTATATGVETLTVEGSQAAADAEAIGVNGDVRAGDNKNDIKIDDHSKSENLSVVLVPPSIPSLSPAPVIAECAECFIQYYYAILQTCGTTTNMPTIHKWDKFPGAKHVQVTMTTLGNFPGLRRSRGLNPVATVLARGVPDAKTYECVGTLTVQSNGKEGHLLALDEMRIYAMQAAQYIDEEGKDSLYIVLSPKATTMHATLVTTGKGWSIAPGAGGPVGSLIGSAMANIGSSSGTATNDWTPELTGIILRMKSDGTGSKSEAFAAADGQIVASAESKPK